MINDAPCSFHTPSLFDPYSHTNLTLSNQLPDVIGKFNVKEEYFSTKLTNKHGGVVVVGDHIFCDADEQNIPSLRALCAVGYEIRTDDPEWRNQGLWRSNIRSSADIPTRIPVHK